MDTKKVFLLLCVTFSCAQAGDLDAPAEKKITVGSEIDRGFEAIFLDTTVDGGTLDRLSAYSNIVARNSQQNRDTDGFVLGASFAIALEANIMVESGMDHPDDALGYENAYLSGFRKKEAALGLTNEQVAKAIFVEHPEKFDDVLAKIEARVKTKSTSASPSTDTAISQSHPISNPTPELIEANTIEEAQKVAIAKYPGLAVAGSPINKAFVALYNRRKESDPGYFQDVGWPLKLAEEAKSAADNPQSP